MTDKQIIIDYKNLCDYYSREVGCYATFDGRCTKEQCSTYKLLQKLQAKEQECEELKKIINEAKNSKLDLKSFLVGEAVQNEYEQQLDQLKAENDTYKKMLEDKDVQLAVQLALTEIRSGEIHLWFNKAEKLSKALAEIKELAIVLKNICPEFIKDGNDSMKAINEILQKISECEVEDV